MDPDDVGGPPADPAAGAERTSRPGGASRIGVALRGVAVALAAVAVVGFLVRPPGDTVPEVAPSPTAPVAPATTAPAPPVPPDTPQTEVDAAATGRGRWATVPAGAPVNALTPGPAVWTGQDLVVGFTPEVAAYTPTLPAARAWRALPPHPDGALAVLGATQARGGEVFVYGAQTCPGCPWEGTFAALDPITASWRRLPDAPGEERGSAEVLTAAGRVVVVRADTAEGPQVLAFDPRTERWEDLAPPSAAGRTDVLAVGLGEDLLLVGVRRTDAGEVLPVALRHDFSEGTWRVVDDPLPLPQPQLGAAVWTGDQVVVLGGPAPDGAPPGVRAAALDLATERWRLLPPLPVERGAPDIPAGRGIEGISGYFDGERAGFVGGLVTPLHLAWSPTDGDWEARRPTTPRLDAVAAWGRDQLLLWGGVDRRGPFQGLQVWPAAP